MKAHCLKAIVALPLAFSSYEAPDKITEAQFLSDETQFSGLFYEGDDQVVTYLATGKAIPPRREAR